MPLVETTPTQPTRKVRNSGRKAVVALFASLTLAAVAVLLILRLPAVAEWWLVAIAWWVIWFLMIAILLYRGGAVRDDVQWSGPRWWFRKNAKPSLTNPRSKSGSSDWFPWALDGVFTCGQLGEFAFMLGIVVAAVVLIPLLAWAVVEVLIPLAALVVYVTLRGALALAAVASGRCRRDLWRTIGFAGFWATAYSAPLAFVLWLCSIARDQ